MKATLIDAGIPTAGRPRGRTLRFWLGWLVVACVLPAWAGTALLIARAYQRESAAFRTGAMATARDLGQAIDTQLESVQTTLTALATSPQIAAGDFAGFYLQAQRVVQQLPIVNVVGLAPSGQQLLNTLVPWGTPLPRDGAPANIMDVFRTGRPIVSNLFVGPVAGRPFVAVCIPVIIDGRLTYGLGMTIASSRLAEILRRERLPPDWIAAIVDQTGTVVARTVDADRYVGRPAAAGLRQALAGAPEGVADIESADGVRVLAAYSRSAFSGWTMALRIPRADAEAELRRSLWLSTGVAIALLLVALALARVLSRHIAVAIDGLRAPALALGHGLPVAAPGGRISEVAEIGEALATADRLLRQRAAEREAALTAEHRMSAARDAAEQASQAKSAFLAMVSHEIRTPMNGIVGYAHLLAEASLAPEHRRYAEVINSSAAALLTIIDDILDLSRIDAGKLAVEAVPVDLGRTIAGALSVVGIAADQKGLALVVRPEAGASTRWVWGDPFRLRQVLINLLGNAVKFTECGTIEVVTGLAADGRVRVAVRDEGIGIPPEAMARLFQRFEQADSTIGRRFGGTGLGLAISRQLVELMGGSIVAESEPGRGSTFSIMLRPAPAPEEPPAPAAQTETSDPGRILVVDDNPVNRGLVEALLKRQGHRLDFAAGGLEAIERAGAVRYDLILMDVSMPDLDGLEASRRIRAGGGPSAAVPIVALTASATADEVARCLAAGMTGHLAKPVSVAGLTGAVEAHLRRGPAAPAGG